MNLASIIAPHLPFLRRYSRALAGDQGSGDAYVAALLESIIAEPSALQLEEQRGADMRVALYRDYCRLWQSVPLNMRDGVNDQTWRNEPGNIDTGDINARDVRTTQMWEQSAQKHLSAVPPKARQAFLLMALEGFKPVDIGSILTCDAETVVHLLAEASTTISNQVATDVMIIEDEPIISMDIEDIVRSLGHSVTGIARTEDEAMELAALHRPGLILADIQLADGSSGLDAVSKLLKQFNVPVIFITAFPERLLTGERPEPTFLITKPFMPDMVKAVISQALFFGTKANAIAQ